jgi:hypothetical protein
MGNEIIRRDWCDGERMTYLFPAEQATNGTVWQDVGSAGVAACELAAFSIAFWAHLTASAAYEMTFLTFMQSRI